MNIDREPKHKQTLYELEKQYGIRPTRNVLGRSLDVLEQEAIEEDKERQKYRKNLVSIDQRSDKEIALERLFDNAINQALQQIAESN